MPRMLRRKPVTRMRSGSASTSETRAVARTAALAQACVRWHQRAAVQVTETVVRRCFEVASLPDTTPEQRKKLLSFIVVRACSRLSARRQAAATLPLLTLDHAQVGERLAALSMSESGTSGCAAPLHGCSGWRQHTSSFCVSKVVYCVI